MAIEPLPPGAPLSTGRLLSDSFKVYFANFLPFTIVTAVALSPLIAYSIFAEVDFTSPSSIWTNVGISLALSMTLPYIAQAAIVYGSVEYMAGRRAPMGVALTRGLGMLLPVLGVAIAGGLLTLLGLLLFVIPGIIIACGLWVAVPAAVMERLSTGDALRRAWSLTEGSRGSIFGALFVLGILEWIVDKVLSGALLDQSSLEALLASLKTYTIVVSVFTIGFGAVKAVMSAVGYSQLRESREGVDIDELAEIFS